MGYDRPPREMHDAKCGDCGKDCQVPFEPRNDKPVYCNDCFQDHKPARDDRGGGGYGRGGGGGGYGGNRDGGRGAGGYGRNSRGGGGGYGRDRPPREMHKTTCGDCGNECEVPFKPSGDKPVYCNDCFQDHKPARDDRGRGRY
jgi:CxxC-x17-CxxC domain-containing protein